MKSTMRLMPYFIAAGFLLQFAHTATADSTLSTSLTTSESATLPASIAIQKSGTVRRADALKNGTKLKILVQGNAKFRVDIGKQIELNNRIRTHRNAHSQSVKVWKAKKVKKRNIDATLKKKLKVKQTAEQRLEAAVSVQAKRHAILEARIQAHAKASLTLQSKKEVESKLRASGAASIQISIGKSNAAALKRARSDIKKATSRQTSTQKAVEKAQTECNSADENVKELTAEVEKAADDVENAEKQQVAAAEELAQSENAVENEEKELKEAESDLTTWESEQIPVDEPTKPADNQPTQSASQDIVPADATDTKSASSESPDCVPTEVETVVIEEPPSEAPENEFGYEEPVWGCFEGEVMFLAPHTPSLPKSYDEYDVASRVYACEWDIPQRKFSRGFPGVEGKFEWFAIRYSGGFHVTETGSYQFRINSDDGTKLYIDGKLIVDNDGTHPPQSRSGTVTLEQGDHQMVLEYFQGPRYLIALQVFVTPPGKSEEIFSVR